MNNYNFNNNPTLPKLNNLMSVESGGGQCGCSCPYPIPAPPNFIGNYLDGVYDAVGHGPETNPYTGIDEMYSESWIQTNASGSGSTYIDDPNGVTDGQLSSTFTLSGEYNFYSKWPVRIFGGLDVDGVSAKISSDGTATKYQASYDGYVTGSSIIGGGELVWAIANSYEITYTLYENPEDRPEYNAMIQNAILRFDSFEEYQNQKSQYSNDVQQYSAQQTTFTSWLIELYDASTYSTFVYTSWLADHPRPDLMLGNESVDPSVQGAIDHTIDPQETLPTFEPTPDGPVLYKPTLAGAPLEIYEDSEIQSILGCRSTSNSSSIIYPMYFLNESGNDCTGDPCVGNCVGTCNITDLCASEAILSAIGAGGYTTETDKSFQIEGNGFSFSTFKNEVLDRIVLGVNNDNSWYSFVNPEESGRWMGAYLERDLLIFDNDPEDGWKADIPLIRYKFLKPTTATNETPDIGFPNALPATNPYAYSVYWEEVWAAENTWTSIFEGNAPNQLETINTYTQLSNAESAGGIGIPFHYLGIVGEVTKQKVLDILETKAGQACKIVNVRVKFASDGLVDLWTHYGLQVPTNSSPNNTFVNEEFFFQS